MVDGETVAEPFRYTVRFPAPITHYAEVDAVFPNDGSERLELFMAVWTPGSYLVREYAKNLEAFVAFDDAGRPLRFFKTRKNRWSIESGSTSSVRVTYRVYCYEMSVRTNWVDERFALLHGAATYLSVVGKLNHAHEVTVIVPEGWSRSFSGMPGSTDYETLVDSPILVGSPTVYEFEVGGKNHLLVNEGEDGFWDGPRSVKDLQAIVRQHVKMWGSLPYERFLFLNVLQESQGGGLEHKDSLCVIGSHYATRTRAGYLKWLWLMSHEHFHVWNVKRLRPVELGPFDYENENYTRQLWMAEGFTEYYTALIVHRAGMTTRDEYLAELSRLIEALQTTPGRLVQSMNSASFDAWIKAYRPNENSCNTSISYYIKGAVIGFLLDAKIRALTAGSKSLDDSMRLAYQRCSGERGFTGAEFQSIAEEVAGTDLQQWFHQALETTEELNYAPALTHYGLRFRLPSNEPPKAWLGLTTKTENGRSIVATVPRGTPAFDAGFSAEDEILAIGDQRVLPDQLQVRMEQFRPGEQASVLVSRRSKLTRVDATFAEEPGKKWQLELIPDADPNQLNAWLEQPALPV